MEVRGLMRSFLGFLTFCCIVSPAALLGQETTPPLETPKTPSDAANVANYFPPMKFWQPPQSTDNASTTPDADPADPQSGGGGARTTKITKVHTTPISSGYVFPSSREINRFWIKNVVGPRALAGSVFRASWGTWVTDSPEEWHSNPSGWSKRFGVGALDNGINQSAL